MASLRALSILNALLFLSSILSFTCCTRTGTHCAPAAPYSCPSSVSAVLPGLAKIDIDTRFVGCADQAFSPSDASTVTPITLGVTALETSLNATTAVVQASGPFTHDIAQEIIFYLRCTLVPDNENTLSIAKGLGDAVRQAGLSQIVVAEFLAIQAAVDALANAIIENTPSELKDAAERILGMYEADYADLIAYFS